MAGNLNCKLCRSPKEIQDYAHKTLYENTATVSELLEDLRKKGIDLSVSAIRRHWKHTKDDYIKSLAPAPAFSLTEPTEKPPDDLPDIDPLRKAQDELNRLDWLSKKRDLSSEESRRLYAMLDYLLKVRVAGLRAREQKDPTAAKIEQEALEILERFQARNRDETDETNNPN